MWLIPNHFAASVSDCFDYLLGTAGERIATERAQPTNVLSNITVSLSPYLRKDPVLRELLGWELARHGRMTGKIPEEMGELLTATTTVSVDGSQKRLTVLTLSPQATEVVNRRLPKPLASGRYALWPQRHLKGRPVRIFPVD
ncbi:MAG: hypothetical protein GY732_02325 [Gammaproteobacteria bacterium]|nr:hypothetical protein [Gammaproteobacteria bacterium]